MSTRATLSYFEIGSPQNISFCWHEYDETAEHTCEKTLHGMVELEVARRGKFYSFCLRWPFREIRLKVRRYLRKR